MGDNSFKNGLCLLSEGCWVHCHGEITLSKMVCVTFFKRVYSKRKEFAPNGSKFFPFRADRFLKGSLCRERKPEVTIVVSLVQNVGKTTSFIDSPKSLYDSLVKREALF